MEDNLHTKEIYELKLPSILQENIEKVNMGFTVLLIKRRLCKIWYGELMRSKKFWLHLGFNSL